MSDNAYVPPPVWKWEKENGGLFSHLNRPVAGATHETELPRGRHPFQLHSLGSPNGQKVTIMFEELLEAGFTDAEYDAWFVDIMSGVQFGTGFVSINPNSKIPALLDYSVPNVESEGPIRVFESGAILLYLADKFGAFIPADIRGRTECLSWLFWQMGTAPMIGGGFGHFYMYGEKIEYPINRYAMETKRIFDVADRRLAEVPYLAGDQYTIADIAVFGWFGVFHRDEAYGNGASFLEFKSYRNIDRWATEIGARRAVRRGIRVNRPGEGDVRERHSAADIDAVVKD